MELPKQYNKLVPKPSLNGEASNQSSINVEEAWKIVKEHLKMTINERERTVWLKDFYLKDIQNGTAYFVTSNTVKKNWIEKNIKNLLHSALKNFAGETFSIDIEVKKVETIHDVETKILEELKENKVSLFNPTLNKLSKLKTAQAKAGLNPKLTIDNFVVGNGNNIAFAIAQAIIEKPGITYNPFFIHGSTGVGKTHLMQAIGNALLEANPDLKIKYCTTEQLKEDFIEAIRTNTTANFRKEYRSVDMLLIDDIQFITNATKTQEELFHTFNMLKQANKQIVLVSDKRPQEIRDLSDRLKSRFQGGMIAEIQPPDYETRMAILQKIRLEIEKETDIKINEHYLEFIAENIDDNIRQLEGAVKNLAVTIKYSPIPLTEDALARLLGLDINTKRKKITPDKVIRAVAESFNISPREVKSQKRSAHIAKARQVAMYILRNELEYPLEKVAHFVNRKDHTTVLHACEKIELLMEEDPSFKNQISSILKTLRENLE